jgi:hypothetical protein
MPRQRQQQQQQRVGVGVGVSVGVSVGVGSQGSGGSESSDGDGSGAGGEEEGRGSREVRGQIPSRLVREGSALARLPVNDDDDHEGFEDTYGDGGMDDDDGRDCWSGRFVAGDALVGRARGGGVGVGVGVGRAKGGEPAESEPSEPSFRLRRPIAVDPRTAAAAAKKAHRRGQAERDRDKRMRGRSSSTAVDGKWEEFR